MKKDRKKAKHTPKTVLTAVWNALKTAGKAVWKALRCTPRPFVWLARKIGALVCRVWQSRKTHPSVWKKALLASLAVLLAGNIAMSAVFVAYSVRTRRDSEWAMSYAVSTADTAAEAADAACSESARTSERTERTLQNWKYRESVYTGTIGDNLTWEINPESASLTISGEGEMGDGFDENQKPAFTMLYRNFIRTINIGSAVTSIAPYAFEDFTALETVNLGSGMETIGDGAFSGCSSLSTVRTGNTPLITIGEYAFCGCSSLKDLFLPQTFEEYHRMSDYNWVRFRVHEENGIFTADEEGCLYTDDGETLLYCPVGIDAEYSRYPDYVIPDTVCKLDEDCFRGNCFNCLIIPGSVKSVCMKGALLNWADQIILRDGVESLSIENTNEEHYMHIGSIKIPDSMKTIDESVYGVVDAIEFSEPNRLLMKAEDGSIYSKDGKTLYLAARNYERTSFTVREGTVRIADGAARNVSLSDCGSISLPDSLEYIGDDNFRCIELRKGKTLTLPDGLTHIGNRCFMSMTVSKIRIPDSVQYIGEDFLLYTNDTRCTDNGCTESETVVVFDGSEAELRQICESALPDGVTMQYGK